MEKSLTVLSSAKLKAIIEFFSEGVYVVDKHGITLLVNYAYEKLTGLKGAIDWQTYGRTENEGIINKSVSLLVLKEKRADYIITDNKAKY